MNMWIRAGMVLLGTSLTTPALSQEAEQFTQSADPASEPTPEQDAEPSAPPEPAAVEVAQEASESPSTQETPAESEPLATIPVEPLAADPEPAQALDDDTAALDDIVVTATKRAQSVRVIPSSIAALPGEKLEQIGAHELKDFIALVPGLNSQDEIAGVQKKLAIRGVGPDTGANQTVGTVFGDVPLSDPYGAYSIADPDPYDLATVEVLKGPQGTLFGATSLAGVIRYVPNLPELGLWSGRISADWVKITEGGTEPAFSLALNAPIGDSAALRFAGSWQHRPGLIDMENPSYEGEDVDDVYTRTGRLMGLWQPTDQLSVNLWHVRGQREADEQSYITDYEGRYARDDAPAPSPVRNGYALTNLDLRYEFDDWGTIVSVSGYQTKDSYYDADASYLIREVAEAGIRSVRTTRDVATKGFLQELRWVSPDDGGPWNWVVGGFYSTYEADVLARLYLYPGSPVLADILNLLPPELVGGFYEEEGFIVTTTGFNPIDASEKALFGEISRALPWDLTLTLGGRLYEAGVAGTRVVSGASTSSGEEAIESVGKGFSPKIALAWRPSNDFMLYGNVSRGFQYGGFNVPLTLPVPPTFDSSTLWNCEIGMRTDWFDRTLRFDLTALYLDWTNPQVYQSTNPPVQGYVDNVGASRSYGAETTIRWFTPLSGLTLESSAAYIIAKSTAPFDDSSGTTIPAGTEMPSSPKLQVTSSASYVWNLREWQTATALMHTYQGAAWNNIAHDVQVGDYHLMGLSFGVTRHDLPFTPGLQLAVTNLLDERALTSALGGSEGPAGDTTPRPVVYTLPRTFRFNLTASF